MPITSSRRSRTSSGGFPRLRHPTSTCDHAVRRRNRLPLAKRVRYFRFHVVHYSVDFGPTSQIKNVADKLFKAKKPGVEGQCPTTTTTTTSSTTSTVVTPTTTTSSTTVVPPTTTTTTTLYGSPSRAFLATSADLLD